MTISTCPCCHQRIRERVIHGALHKARIDAGYSLAEAAQAAGITKGYLSELERKPSLNPSVYVALALSRVYGLDVTEIFSRETKP